MGLESLSISDAVEKMQDGSVDCTRMVEDCLTRITAFEPTIKAWAWMDRDQALRQAEMLDEHRKRGNPVGRLHGIPVGLKDIIDTRLIPTEHGFPLFSGRLPASDATLVTRLRDQGALILGKTETCALATFMPGRTTNPHNAAHTPGGSSSGSAAAVAAYMAPGAVGTQTNGSVIRPASFCGTVGFKPSFGLIPRTGVLRQSPFLDQIGVFTRNVEDAALMAEVMMGHDTGDEESLSALAPPGLQQVCQQEPPLPPRFGFVKTAVWSKADKDTQEGFVELVEALGGQVAEVELGAGFDTAWETLETINEADIATWYASIFQQGQAYFDDVVSGQIERGRQITAKEYINARLQRPAMISILGELFDEYDTLITPAAIGEAPTGLSHTGDPCFCTTWTLAGIPSVSLPLLQGSNGLPIGVQLVGGYLDDARLLRTARWLERFASEDAA